MIALDLFLLVYAMVVGINHTTRFTASIGNQNTHDFPNVDGAGASVGDAHGNRSAIDARGQDGIHAQVVNDDSSAALTAKLEGTNWSDKDSFSEAVEVDSDANVASAGGVTQLEDTDRSFDVYRVTTTFNAAPNGDDPNVTVDFGFNPLRG